MLGLFKRKEVSAQPPAESAATSDRPKRRGLGGRTMQRIFAAASTDRLNKSWGTMPLTADDIVQRHQRVLVARSREQAARNDYAKAFIRMCRQNVVGSRGVQLQAESRDPGGELDTLANDAIEAAFKEWSKPENCDVTGRQSMRSMENSAVSSAAKDGEFMFQIVTGADAGPWGFALQILDPQRCPVDFEVKALGDRGKFVRHGIEFNRYGRPLAYYFTTTEEGEANYSYGGRHFVRVPAAKIIHGFIPELVGQKRGLPWMATSLWRLRMLGGFEEAALVNARASASKLGFLEWQEGYGPESDEDEEVLVDGEAGTWQELPAGLKAQKQDWEWPSGEMAAFSKSMLRGAASGFGVLYNNLASDLEGVNFSSIRQGTLDEREHWKELQEWLVETLMDRVFQEWLPRALLAGRIKLQGGGTLKAEKLQKYRSVSWQARRWQWIDPAKDVAANVNSQAHLHTSPGQIIRDSGRDPAQVWREIGRDIEQMKASGIPEEFITAALNSKLTGNSNGNSSQQNDDT